MSPPSRAGPYLSERGQRGTVLLFLIAGAIVLAGTIWTALNHDAYGDFSDPYEYMVFADYYRGALIGKYEYWLNWYYRQTRYPPLFPLFLALSGGGAQAVVRSVLLTQACVLLAAAAVAWQLTLALKDARAAAWLLLVVALMPGLFLLYQDPVSEPLLVALLYGGMSMYLGKQRAGGLLLLAMAPLARMVGVVAIPAASIWQWRESRGKPVRIRIGDAAQPWAALLPALAWLLYRRTLPVTNSYLGDLAPAHILAAFGGVSGLLVDRPWAMVHALASYLDPRGSTLAICVAVAMTLFMLVGLTTRLRSNRLDAWVLAGYLFVVWIWPYPRETGRLLSCALPLILIAAHEGMRFVAASIPRSKLARPSLEASCAALLFAGALAAMAPAQTTILGRMLRPSPNGLEAYKHTSDYLLLAPEPALDTLLSVSERLDVAVRSIGASVPPQDCVYDLVPQRVFALAHRMAIRTPFDLSHERNSRAEMPFCRYVFVTYQRPPRAEDQSYYPREYLEGTFDVAAEVRLGLGTDDMLVAQLLHFREASGSEVGDPGARAADQAGGR